MDDTFSWDGNTANGKPATVTFTHITDPLNPDGDPDVQVTLTVGGEPKRSLIIPSNALLAYVADLIRDARIEELREMADDEVLGLPELALEDDYEEV